MRMVDCCIPTQIWVTRGPVGLWAGWGAASTELRDNGSVMLRSVATGTVLLQRGGGLTELSWDWCASAGALRACWT
jgi:hypothetical protein